MRVACCVSGRRRDWLRVGLYVAALLHLLVYVVSVTGVVSVSLNAAARLHVLGSGGIISGPLPSTMPSPGLHMHWRGLRNRDGALRQWDRWIWKFVWRRRANDDLLYVIPLWPTLLGVCGMAGYVRVRSRKVELAKCGA